MGYSMIAFSFSFVLLAAAGAEASPAPARPFRATHYDAELEIVPATRSVRGVVGIELLGGVDGLGEIDLDCNGLTIDEVSKAGAALAFVQRPALLQISAAKPWRAGERHTLTVRYHGEPRQGLRFFAGGWLTAFNTQGWLPCDADPAHKATLTLRLIVPAELTVLATGELMSQEPRPDGRQRLTWKLERPHSSYLFGMVAGRFVTSCTTSAGVRVCAAADAAHAGQLAHATAIAGAALPFFAERAGFAFPGTHYDQVFVPSKVAQEMAGLSVMSESYLDELAGDARADWLVLHELIHQWWGNSVTARSWSDLWLNEGITSFLVAAYKEKRWGRVEYEEELALARGSVGKARAAGRRRALASDDWKQPGDMGGPLTYSAGILFMNFLRAELGETAFWA